MDVSVDVKNVGECTMITFVHHVPTGASACVTASKRRNVVVHDADERGVVEATLSHPCRELAVPDQVVAMDLDTVLGCVVDVAVGILEGEDTTLRLGRLPLLSVLRRDAGGLISLEP